MARGFNRFVRLVKSQQARFLMAGVWNTVFGFTLYGLSLVLLGDELYWVALVLSHSVSSTVAFMLYRSWVFRVSGSWGADFLRFHAVYSVGFILNAVLLVALVVMVAMPPLTAQVICQVIVIVMTFIGHKYFSFYRPMVAPSDGEV